MTPHSPHADATSEAAFARAERMQAALSQRGIYGPPPRSTKAIPHGLGPARAELIHFAAWQAETEAALAHARASRPQLLATFDLPSAAEADIADLVKDEASGVRRWVRGIVSGLSPAEAEGFDPRKLDLRAYERHELEQRLASDRHRADVARAALDELEAETEILEAAVAKLAERKGEFVRAAVLEETEPYARRYVEALHDAAAALKVLLAAAGRSASAKEMKAPVFETPFFREMIAAGGGAVDGLTFGFGPVELAKAEMPWRALSEALVADPLAKAGPILSAPPAPDPFEPSNGVRSMIYAHSLRGVPMQTMNVCPAADVIARGEMDPLPEWFDEFGEHAQFRVHWFFGEAEVDAALADFLVARGHAVAEPYQAEAA